MPKYTLIPSFTPFDFHDKSSYLQSNVTLKIFPIQINKEYPSYTNKTMNLQVQSQNYGLLVEHRNNQKEIFYINKEQPLNISLLDYFDGSNQAFHVFYNNKFIDNSQKIIVDYSIDTYEIYIIDAATNINRVTKAILINSNFLLLFYSQNHLLQVSYSDSHQI